MNHHRFRAIMDPPDHPDAVPPTPDSSAFLIFPVMLSQGAAGPAPLWPQVLYYLAFQQAQAVCQPSLLQRQLTPLPN